MARYFNRRPLLIPYIAVVVTAIFVANVLIPFLKAL